GFQVGRFEPRRLRGLIPKEWWVGSAINGSDHNYDLPISLTGVHQTMGVLQFGERKRSRRRNFDFASLNDIKELLQSLGGQIGGFASICRQFYSGWNSIHRSKMFKVPFASKNPSHTNDSTAPSGLERIQKRARAN